MSELFSKEALILILGGWQYAASNGPDSWKDKAADFLRASDYAGIAFGNAGCAAVHALSYPLGASHHIPHGQSNQLMFADVMRKYQEKKPVGKLNQLEDILADIFGTESASALSALYTLMETPLNESGLWIPTLLAFPILMTVPPRLMTASCIPFSMRIRRTSSAA